MSKAYPYIERAGTIIRVWAYVPVETTYFNGEIKMKGILLWLVGIPIPVIILLYLFNVL